MKSSNVPNANTRSCSWPMCAMQNSVPKTCEKCKVRLRPEGNLHGYERHTVLCTYTALEKNVQYTGTIVVKSSKAKLMHLDMLSFSNTSAKKTSLWLTRLLVTFMRCETAIMLVSCAWCLMSKHHGMKQAVKTHILPSSHSPIWMESW